MFGDTVNKWQIICPVVAMVVFGAIVFSGQARRNIRYYITAQTTMVGQELVRGTNSSRLAEISPALQHRLSGFLASPSGVADVMLGDERPPIGDGTACSRLVLSNAVGARLGIRLRQEATADKFHVLGFWTITEPRGAANRGQPVASETNRTSAATGAGG